LELLEPLMSVLLVAYLEKLRDIHKKISYVNITLYSGAYSTSFHRDRECVTYSHVTGETLSFLAFVKRILQICEGIDIPSISHSTEDEIRLL